MCGVAGIVGPKASEVHLRRMLEAQHHRGPDHTGIHCETGLALGHNRLSIIDLSEAAHQPFFSQDRRYSLSFNGEIYNYLELRQQLQSQYPFVTQSDTEVLLAAFIVWGADCLHHLNGMFSFAIWDDLNKELWLARDRFGVKPLYYHQEEDTFFFSSEIKALFAAGIRKKTNESVWMQYLCFGSYGLPDQTFWEGIHQLPGGHFAHFKQGHLQLTKWYHFEQGLANQPRELSFEQAKQQYLSLLEDSISLRFRSDVPVGFNISGGLDSSALLAMVNRSQDRAHINAYTFYTGDDRYDELPWVEQLIATTENPLHAVRLDVDEVPNLAKTLAYLQDEPYGGVPTIAYAHLFTQARKDGVIVLLDGQGMDEQWAGYDYYMKADASVIQGVTASPFRKNVLNPEWLAAVDKTTYPQPFGDRLLDTQYRDLFYTKIPRALRFNDRVSMAASTELREPFLDYRLVEFAVAQPKAYKIKQGVQKYLLRKLVADFVPDTIRYAPKRPLQTPQREWLGNELQSWVRDRVSILQDHDWFQADALDQELNRYFAGQQQSSFHLWQWINLSYLLDQT